MATWTVYSVDTECGYCGALIPKLQPVCLKLGKLRRCATCAGEQIDRALVDAARRGLEDHVINAELARARARMRIAPLMRQAAPFDAKLAAAADDGEVK